MLRTRRSPDEWQHSLLTWPPRLWPGWTCTSWTSLRGFANASSFLLFRAYPSAMTNALIEAAVRDRRLGSFTHCGIFENGRSACNLAHVADRNPAMTPCTEFCFSRRIQRAAAYKVHRSVGQKIASGGCGSLFVVHECRSAASSGRSAKPLKAAARWRYRSAAVIRLCIRSVVGRTCCEASGGGQRALHSCWPRPGERLH